MDDDFDELVDGTGKLKIGDFEKFQQEVNLLYVAMTRAQRAIELNRQFDEFMAAVKVGKIDPIGATSKVRPNEAAQPPASVAEPLQPSKQSLAEKIGRMNLSIGLMSCQSMGKRMNICEEIVAAEEVRMISYEELTSLYFVADNLVQAKLKAQGHRSPEITM